MKLKNYITVLLLMLNVSCTIAYHPTAGTYATVGADTKKWKQDQNGFSFEENKNSESLKYVADKVEAAWKSYLLLKGLEFLAGKYYTHEGKLVDSNTTIKLEELRNARSAQESADALKALETTLKFE